MAEDLYKKAKAICETNYIQEQGGPRCKQKMEEYVVESSCGTSSNLNNVELLKKNLYFPCLDRMINELDQRFTGVRADLMKGIQACHPASATFLSEEFLIKVTVHYKIQLKIQEIRVVKKFLARKKETGATPDVLSAYRYLDSDMFPTLKAIFQVAMTIPVRSCSCE
ncbi:hypothetical protein Hamer_G019013 [Homarus americanus]|uniref:Uncharacterized protein n=1 Tax=Homarus americanus TaxID=6706 RepID=A0A8J5MIF5_HOMAM|nr:hypothetical protein Hamer_G019514 [Homarus americanus]KAG7167624.1 hypothetical protein Hamer_G019013 [Homarus americanus]